MRDSALPRRQYTDEFKAEAIRVAQSVGGHQAARRLGVPVSTIGNWSRRGRLAALIGAASTVGVEAMPVASTVGWQPTTASRCR